MLLASGDLAEMAFLRCDMDSCLKFGSVGGAGAGAGEKSLRNHSSPAFVLQKESRGPL